MRTHGTLTKWNDDRGFGFITPAKGTGDLFVRISVFPRALMIPGFAARSRFWPLQALAYTVTRNTTSASLQQRYLARTRLRNLRRQFLNTLVTGAQCARR